MSTLTLFINKKNGKNGKRRITLNNTMVFIYIVIVRSHNIICGVMVLLLLLGPALIQQTDKNIM
jgi:hypothetical protein